MKKNQPKYNRINVLFYLTILLFSPFISNGQLNLDAAGKVGIGTSGPISGLHIKGSYPTGYLTVERTGVDGLSHVGIMTLNTDAKTIGDGTVFGFGALNSSSAEKQYGQIRMAIISPTASSETGSLEFYTLVNGTNSIRMKIAASGRVGVGTPTPVSKLDVEGGVSIGAFYSGATAAPTDGAIIQGNVGIGTSAPGIYRLNVQGDFNLNGAFSGNGANNYTSDQQFKTNIDSLHNALTTIYQLRPKSFYFDTTNVYGLNFSDKKQYGFLAQDIENILPELVSSITKSADVDTLGNIVHPGITYKGLNYNAFIAILTKGIQEQKQSIDSLKTKIINQDSINSFLQNSISQQHQTLDSLKTKNTSQDILIASLQNQMNTLTSAINACCDNHHGNGNHGGNREVNSTQTDIILNDAQSIILEQNVPNPFAEQTTINYSLPDNTMKAQMLFYNAQGKLIQSTELTQKGEGSLNVFARDLSNGIYTYTLLVDGKIIETKKMVKE